MTVYYLLAFMAIVYPWSHHGQSVLAISIRLLLLSDEHPPARVASSASVCARQAATARRKLPINLSVRDAYIDISR